MSTLVCVLLGYVLCAEESTHWELHPYLEGRVGFGYIHTEALSARAPIVQNATSYQSSMSGIDTSASLGLLWQQDKWGLGSEIGFSQYHDSTYHIVERNGLTQSITYTLRSIDALVVAKCYFYEPFSAAVLFGASYAMQQVDINGVSTHAQHLLPTVDFALGLRLSHHVELTLDSRYMHGHYINLNRLPWDPYTVAEARSTNLGLRYTF